MNPRRRNGFTLIEMLVVMTAGMTVLMLAIGMIHKSMHMASSNRSKMDQSTITDRFLREFRQDAHQAISFDLEDGVQYELPDGSRIRYTTNANTVSRTYLVNDQPIAKESFDIGDDRTVTFSSDQSDRISLRIETSQPTQRLDRHLTSVVGRWLAPTNDQEVTE